MAQAPALGEVVSNTSAKERQHKCEVLISEAIDKSRLRERVGALDTSEMKQIDWALGVSVGLVEGYR